MQTLYIRHDSYLYTLRVRGSLIVSIQRSHENNREPEYLTWDDLDEDLQEKITQRMKGEDE